MMEESYIVFEEAIEHTIKVKTVLDLLEEEILAPTDGVAFYLAKHLSLLGNKVDKLIDRGLFYPEEKYKRHFGRLKSFSNDFRREYVPDYGVGKIYIEEIPLYRAKKDILEIYKSLIDEFRRLD